MPSLRKAISIRQRANNEKDRNVRYLVVPGSRFSEKLNKVVRSSGLVIVSDTGKKISDLVKEKKENEKNDNSVVYKIPCSGCDKAYIGETYRGLRVRTREHELDF